MLPLFSSGAQVYADTSDLSDYSYAKSNGIPVMIINCDKSVAEINASKENAGKGSLAYFDAEGDEIYSGELKSIKGRGSSSWSQSIDQKPYNIKLSEKAVLIDGAGAGKKWCLLGGDCYSDYAKGKWVWQNPTLATMLGFQLYEDIDGNYAIHVQPIDLYINGEYRGNYLLTEAVQISDARVDIAETVYKTEGTKTQCGRIELSSNGKKYKLEARYSTDAVLTKEGGYILELECSDEEVDDCYFYTARGNRVLFKDPDMPSKAQLIKVAQYFQDFEDALYSETGYNSKGKYYSEYFDVETNAKAVATKLFCADCDFYAKSIFYVIDIDANGNFSKMYSGPCWDFDGCYYGHEELYVDNSEMLFNRNILLMLLSHNDFMTAMNSVLKNEILPVAKSYAQSGGIIEYWTGTLSKSKAATHEKYSSSLDFNGSANTALSAAKFLKDFRTHVDFFENQWNDSYLTSYSQLVKSYVNTYNTYFDSFSDVPVDSYYRMAVNWAVANQITVGTGNGKFSPYAPCARYQTLRFIYNACGVQLDAIADPNGQINRAEFMYYLWLSAGSPDPGQYRYFTDVASDAYYAKAVYWAASNGISYGIGNNKFGPNTVLSRADAMCLIYRYFE